MAIDQRHNVNISVFAVSRWRHGYHALFFLLLLTLLSCAGWSAPKANQPVLIVYDTWQQVPNPTKADREAPPVSLADAEQLQQLLGHFPYASKRVPLAAYHSGMLAQYPYVFVLGNVKKGVLPVNFLNDVRRYHGSLYWMNYHVGQLDAPFLSQLGFAFLRLETEPGYTHVHYHGAELAKGDTITNVIKVTMPGRCTQLAEALPEKNTGAVPYIVRSGNFWYIADSPFSYAADRDRYFAFADTLFDFFDVKVKPRKRAIIRIEDINPETDPGVLRDIANRMAKLRAPFVMSLIPRYQNPNNHVEIRMANRPDYVNALHYMTTHGGSVAMHGWTHRYKGVTADDFEFWNVANGKPIPEDSAEYVRKHLMNGLDDCFDAHLYPLAWETPHYAASSIDYDEIGKHFSTAIEQRVLLDKAEFSQYFPFVIQRDIHGQQIFPENLGYIAMQVTDDKDEDIVKEKGEVDEILKNAHDLGVLRDVTVGAFIHPFLDTSLVTRLVEGLQREGYTFIDLREENNRVQLDDMLIGTGIVQGQIKLDRQFIHEFYLDNQGRTKRESFSKTKVTGIIQRKVTVPPGEIYVCCGVRSRPPSWLTQTRENVVAALTRLPANGTSPEEPEVKEPARAAILCSPHPIGETARDQASFIRALTTMGMAPQQIPVAQMASDKTLDPYNVLVVPQASAQALSATQIKLITEEVDQGLNILLEGMSPLAHTLGIKQTTTTCPVSAIRDLVTLQTLTWPSPTLVHQFTYPIGANIVYHVDGGSMPVGAWFNVHRGHCLALATLFDPISGLGYSRFPTLPNAFFTAFPVTPSFTARDLELFFEPGMRTTISIERLVLQWKKWGVRAIHAATWHFFPNYTYDYERLITNCHNNGIAVYAWFEFPYVSPKFYDEHPEWHEKTAAGTDAAPGWRQPVAIEIPECRKAVIAFMTDLLKRYDWDGVNLAELYFENQSGPDNPQQFVPMHPYVRTTFKQRYGFDPAELCARNSRHFWRTHPRAWRQFVDFRAQLLHETYQELLTALQPFQRGSDQLGRRDIVVTALDTINYPEIQHQTGLDIRDLLNMMDTGKHPAEKTPAGRFDFVLNVEDPQRAWDAPPDRYLKIGAQYRRLVTNPAKLALDLNILNFRKPDERRFATQTQVGLEALEMVRCARAATARVIIYCEATLSPYDTDLLGVASAAAGTYEECPGGFTLDAPGMLYLRGQNEDHQIALHGDALLVNERGEAALPGGKQRIQIRDDLLNIASDIPVIRLLNLTGELRRMHARNGGLLVEYDAQSPCLLTFDQEPQHLWVDGKVCTPTVLEGDGSWSIRCPASHHTVIISAQDPPLFYARVASAISSWMIVTFGGVASLILLILILLTHLGRLRETRKLGEVR